MQCLLCRVLLRNAECPRYDQDKHYPKTGVFSRNVRLLQSLAWPNKRPGYRQKLSCLKGTQLFKRCHNATSSMSPTQFAESVRVDSVKMIVSVKQTSLQKKMDRKSSCLLSIWRLSPVLCCCAGLTILGIKLFCATCSSAALVRISPQNRRA